ncbi:MAG: acylphosphatase [Acidimicrobiales bacterium]
MGRIALRLVIAGRVQGVGFRESCRRVAAAADVDGWVRNRADGRVEAWLEGEASAVERVAAWCQRGPAYASVGAVEVTDESPAGYDGFAVGTP